MEKPEYTENAFDPIKGKIINGQMAEAVQRWQKISETNERCLTTCANAIPEQIQKCAVCLIGELLTKASSNYRDHGAAEKYVSLADDLQCWIDRTPEVKKAAS